MLGDTIFVKTCYLRKKLLYLEDNNEFMNLFYVIYAILRYLIYTIFLHYKAWIQLVFKILVCITLISFLLGNLFSLNLFFVITLLDYVKKEKINIISNAFPILEYFNNSFQTYLSISFSLVIV